MTITRTAPSLCPLCGYTVDAHELLVDPELVPGPGDYTVCMACAAVLEYDGGMRLKLPVKAEVDEAMADPESGLADTIAAIRAMHAAVGPPKVQRGKPT